MTPIWRFFGADEPNYATMKDGRRLLSELGELRPQGVYFRTHNLLCTGDGTPAFKWGSTNAYSEWKRLGSPAAPDESQYARMKEAGGLCPVADATAAVQVEGGGAVLHFLLPRAAVSLLVLDWQ